ncbi:hypothetical protein VOLCADRAFT_94060 [Volvox carteri f. nagariensis]|uniref:Aromatic amino acid beta-eliminating lyase/threonine aldolase domain-containing protein n=1 Tax=Volvox carteri f. nagariensis TaxID=3068 RepID=D8U3T6_VOLCA|nr:uncharacterized protein VOLCADRAFT_94060 [Volvox carteri f. nagariensis]EFJ45584.1 hypothetical protein VOLCADRAFT_94060 [Volvox carteri f. nagariensis]|eukprot:XP_002953274.1 hypothetical protein VOLCADRAFT_94060 [Volvox carteri f. nagariensis]
MTGSHEPPELGQRRVIDLRSDTVTKPTPKMLQAMMNAEVGDDVWGDDPTVNELQDFAAQMFGKEAGLFCPSGTMTNQIAIKVHTHPGDELLCADNAHIYLYEGGGIAFNSGRFGGGRGGVQPGGGFATCESKIIENPGWLLASSGVRLHKTYLRPAFFVDRLTNLIISNLPPTPASAYPTLVYQQPTKGVQPKLLPSNRGRISAEQIVQAINMEDSHFPTTRLVCLENTSNKGGGAYYSLDELRAISKVCSTHGLRFHLDGARIFNAAVEAGYGPADVGPLFDSISVCLSKGLGCPVGSLLLGSRDFIRRAHRVRKVLGGGMRQAGFLAAAGLYALKNNIDRLRDDHARARRLGATLDGLPYVSYLAPVDTNIVIFHVAAGWDARALVEWFQARGVLLITMGRAVLRLVTHLGVDDEDVDRVCELLKEAARGGRGGAEAAEASTAAGAVKVNVEEAGEGVGEGMGEGKVLRLVHSCPGSSFTRLWFVFPDPNGGRGRGVEVCLVSRSWSPGGRHQRRKQAAPDIFTNEHNQLVDTLQSSGVVQMLTHYVRNTVAPVAETSNAARHSVHQHVIRS